MSRVMVVDDSLFMRTLIKEMVQKLGHIVLCEASNGREAIANYKLYQPDIVTLDITMPDIDGITVLKEVMSFDPNAKIILCSAFHSQSLVIQGIKDGALDFVEKPFNLEKLRISISNASNEA